jgi:hypothetical protein
MNGIRRMWWVAGLAIAVIVVAAAAAFASGDPDGLEAVAEEQGFIETAQDALYELIPDYTFPGLDDPVISTIVAGLIGIGIVFALMIGLGRLLRRRPSA